MKALHDENTNLKAQLSKEQKGRASERAETRRQEGHDQSCLREIGGRHHEATATKLHELKGLGMMEFDRGQEPGRPSEWRLF